MRFLIVMLTKVVMQMGMYFKVERKTELLIDIEFFSDRIGLA